MREMDQIFMSDGLLARLQKMTACITVVAMDYIISLALDVRRYLRF